MTKWLNRKDFEETFLPLTSKGKQIWVNINTFHPYLRIEPKSMKAAKRKQNVVSLKKHQNMLTKLKLLKTIKDLPENFTFDELLDHLMLLQKVEIGLEQSQKGKIKSTAQAKEKLKKWLT